jgi:hypothetical protein
MPNLGCTALVRRFRQASGAKQNRCVLIASGLCSCIDERATSAPLVDARERQLTLRPFE